MWPSLVLKPLFVVFIKLDEKKAAGNELDEFWSHKFLESIGETLTILEVCGFDRHKVGVSNMSRGIVCLRLVVVYSGGTHFS